MTETTSSDAIRKHSLKAKPEGSSEERSHLVSQSVRSPFYFVPVCLSRDDSKLPWLYITQYAELSSRLPSLLLSISSNKRPTTQWG